MQISNNEGPKQQRGKISAFSLRHSFGIRHWSFVISRLVLVLILMLEISCVGRRITKANVDDHAKSENPDVKRLLGTEGKHGEALGLTNDWAVRIIKHVGNYGEVFERNVGQGSPLKIARGLNALWNKGGLQFAPPVR